MAATHLFAGLAVTDYEAARTWYERLFGRAPDMIPTADEAVWHVTETASVYVVADPERAGAGTVAIAVDDLAAHIAALGERGIAGQTASGGGGPRRVVVTDPDGNRLTFFEAPSRAD